jgi:cytochrome c oxidase cbb3-type subunit III
MRLIQVIFAGAIAIAFIACDREERDLRVSPSAAVSPSDVTLTPLRAGGPSTTTQATWSEYDENAYALSEGKRLFTQMNCVGCHAHGGGGMAPPLMDEKWIYGSEPDQVHATIIQGRPNGMPSFANRIPDYQVWQLAAYVRSMGGLVSGVAAPGRDDRLKGRPPENSTTQQTPAASFHPPSADMP